MKLTEPTRVCPHCQTRKVWSEFWPKTKWPDGTVRVPQSWCKACHKAKRPNAAKRRQSNARYWAKYKSNPALYEDHLERRRFRYHIARGTTDRPGKLSVVDLPAAPFAEWLRKVMARDGTNMGDTAVRLWISARNMQRILQGQKVVELSMVERALIADDTVSLFELYPDWFEEAA